MIWAFIKSRLGGFGAIIAAVFAAFLYGRTAGANRIKRKHEKQKLMAIKTEREVRNEVENLRPDDVSRRLGDWMRDEDL